MEGAKLIDHVYWKLVLKEYAAVGSTAVTNHMTAVVG